MILVQTSIRADHESSGTFYPRETLDELLSAEVEVPGAFDIDLEKKSLEGSASLITVKSQFKLVGFDLLNDVLYAKIEGDESILDHIAETDYKVRFIVRGQYEVRDGVRTLIEVEDIRGVTLVEQNT